MALTDVCAVIVVGGDPVDSVDKDEGVAVLKDGESLSGLIQ